MPRYESNEDGSSKFWDIQVSGSDVTVRFGRIGTAGQTKTKVFGDEAGAARERDKLVRGKTGKGYRLVAGEDASAVAAPSVATAPAPPAALPVEASASIASPRADEFAAPAIDTPHGGFQWSPELQSRLPIVRGLQTLSPLQYGSLHVRPEWCRPLPLSAAQQGLLMRAMGSSQAWWPWTPTVAAQSLSAASLDRRDVAHWLDICVQSGGIEHYACTLTGVAIRKHGAAFMVDVLLSLFDIVNESPGAAAAVSMMNLLRHEVAAIDASAHDAALGAAARRRTDSPAIGLACAYLFPQRADWAEACVDAGTADRSDLLRHSAMSPEHFVRHCNRKGWDEAADSPAILLQVQLHGEAAGTVLARLLAVARERPGKALSQTLDFVAHFRSPQLIPMLAAHLDKAEARHHLQALRREFPAAVLRDCIGPALRSASTGAMDWLLPIAEREPAALGTALGVLSADERAAFTTRQQAAKDRDCAPDRLPALLRSPPWLGKQRTAALPQFEVAVLAVADRFGWSDEERARQAQAQPIDRYGFTYSLAKQAEPDRQVLNWMRLDEAVVDALLQGRSIDSVPQHRERYTRSPCSLDYLLWLRDAGLALRVWQGYPLDDWNLMVPGTYYGQPTGGLARIVHTLAARAGLGVLPGVLRLVTERSPEYLSLCTPFDSLMFAVPALRALRGRKGRAGAAEWIKANPRTAAVAALPMAFGRDEAAAADAQFALRWMASNGLATPLHDVAATYGGEMPAATCSLLDFDPLLALPPRMPKLPAWLDVPALKRPELRDGGALPAAATAHVVSMLAISRLDAPYAGLDVVREACTPASLADFAWSLFEAWMAADAPGKDAWCLTSLGLFGDDAVARRLGALMLHWPQEGGTQRAGVAVDVLGAIGSDVALLQLDIASRRVKSKGLVDRVRSKLEALARERGLSSEELADRVVPDLGLDAQGTRWLDYGLRRLRIVFDEALLPTVMDDAGVRLKKLPKPAPTDDAARVAEADEQFKQLRADAKAVAAVQIKRLETAMETRRRWNGSDFRQFIVTHPLLRHLAQRLVWGVYIDDKLAHAFRVAEDGTLADHDDALYTLADDASVGVVHFSEAPADVWAAFHQIFADYEILQPFRQLNRDADYEARRAEHARGGW